MPPSAAPTGVAPLLTSPVPPELTGAEGALELLPIPAVLIDHPTGGARFEATNRAFREAGLGQVAAQSILLERCGARIAAFVEDGGERLSFAWQLGEAVDCRHYEVTLARIHTRGEQRCLATLVDRTSELRTEYSLRREMTTDSLTGLPNRAGFSDRLEEAIGGGQRQSAVLIVDLERFSRVNACLGTLTGDELLITVARRLKGALRARDVLARIGGDEFGILLTLDDGPGDADQVARRLRGALSSPFQLADLQIKVACSIGIAFAADNADDAEQIIRHAQFAVKRSKASGRDESYRAQAFDSERAQFRMETALRRAIDGGLLTLAYQPIVDLATGRITAFEALARWHDEAMGNVSPAEFIPVAEASGLIVPLGRWAIHEATDTLAGWDTRAGGGCGVAMAVNLSAIQLLRDDVAHVVERALTLNGLPGGRLKLELTESALVDDPAGAAATLEALKALGTTLAMDDFGTGYSNLAYLQKLPIDILKIDRSFVTGMLADRDKVAIVRAILSLAQALGMKTVAEGVETPELGQTLAALGCTFGQGFAYSRPLPADEAYALLVSRNA